jgi:transitional endoplasmic reticulum ATPase
MAETLAQKNAAQKATVKIAEVVKMGEKIVLPTDMTFDEAILHLMRMKKYEEETVQPVETFDAFPWDGANAMVAALNELYGWFSLEQTPGFFGPKPPQMRTIDIGVDRTTQVPWGRFTVPVIPHSEGYLETSVGMKNGRYVFQLSASLLRKYEGEFKRITAEIRRQLTLHSIYKGQAFKVRFLDDAGGPLGLPEPQFIALNPDAETNLVLNYGVERQVVTNLFTPLKHLARLRHFRMAFKRGVLLAGFYGTGKTMISLVTALIAVRNGITFILCPRADELALAVDFARQYAPAVVFCEDIDRVIRGERTVTTDDLLNTIDGIESKKSDVMVVMTSNDADAIQKAMIRPGRLDSVIEILPPDAQSVERLIKVYARERLAPNANLKPVGHKLAGQIPSTIEECVKKATMYAMSQLSPDDPVDTLITIDGDDLLAAAEGMQTHIDMLNGTKVREVPPMVVAAEILGHHIVNAFEAAGRGIAKREPELVKGAVAALPDYNPMPWDGDDDNDLDN